MARIIWDTERDIGGLYEAGSLFRVARKAYERIETLSSQQLPDSQDVLIVIVFSAIALEAFFNELPAIAALHSQESPDEDVVKNFATLLNEAEDSHAQITLKYLLIGVAFTGKAFKKGSITYQDFKLLIDLRNTLVHLKAISQLVQDSTGKTAIPDVKILKSLRAKKLLKEYPDAHESFIGKISTRAVSRWACNTTVETVRSVVDILPSGTFKIMAKAYAQGFSPVK